MAISEKAQRALDNMIHRFQDGDLSAIVRIALIREDPNDPRPMAHWSLANRVIAFAQTASLDCRGFRQWKEADRHVSKGSHAAYILGPRTITDPKDEDRKIVAGFFSIPVFADLDTEGDQPLADPLYSPAELPPLQEAAKRLGLTVAYSPPIDPARGAYYPGKKAIRLHTHNVKTWFHELAHAAHDKLEGVKGGQHADQETIAEFTACVLMEMYGFGDYSGNSWQYIHMYSDDPLTAIYKAIATVEKVLAILLQ